MGKLAFDQYAERYDAWFIKNANVLASEVLLVKHALGEPGKTLSVGCGSGLFESILQRDHGLVITEGIEPSEAMAMIARKRGMSVTVATADANPHEDGSFDTVLMNGIPAYLPSLEEPFAEAFRVLKSGGHVVVGDVPASSSYGILYKLAGLVGSWDDPHLKKVAPLFPYPAQFVKDVNWRTTDEIVAALTTAGFVDFEFAQTLTTHAKFSDDAVEQPVPGYDRGGYVAIRARKA